MNENAEPQAVDLTDPQLDFLALNRATHDTEGDPIPAWQKDAFFALVAGLEDLRPDVVSACAQALVKVGWRAAVRPMLEALRRQSEVGASCDLIDAIAELAYARMPEVVETLADLAQNAGDDIPVHASLALCKLGVWDIGIVATWETIPRGSRLLEAAIVKAGRAMIEGLVDTMSLSDAPATRAFCARMIGEIVESERRKALGRSN